MIVSEIICEDEPKNTLTPEQSAAFADAADTQRGKPENAMLKAVNIAGGGVWSYALEHVGDLTHRMMEKPDWNIWRGQEYVADKAEKILRSLQSGYGFKKEFMENLNSAYRYAKENGGVPAQYDTIEDFLDAVTNAGKEYSKEHRKVPVFNKPQWLARQAAVELGELNFDKTEMYLIALLEIVNSGSYEEQASHFEKDYRP